MYKLDFPTPLQLLLVSGMISACGMNTDSSALRDAAVDLSYQQWCSTHQLECPEANPEHQIISTEQWSHIAAIGRSFLGEMPAMRLQSQDLQAEELLEAVKRLDMAELYAEILSFLEDHAIEAVHLDDGRIQLEKGSESKVTGPSELTWALGNGAQLSLGEQDQIELSGLTFTYRQDQDTQSLERLHYSSAGFLTAHTPGNHISDIPLSFVLQESQVTELPTPTQDLSRWVSAIPPLRSWLFTEERRFSMDANFFQQVSPPISALVEEKFRAPIQLIIANIASMSTNPVSPLVQVAFSGANVRCEIQLPRVPAIEFTLAAPMRIQAINVTQEQHIQIQLEGFAGRLMIPGPFKPRLNIAEIILTQDRLIIPNVPVIGKIGVPYDSMQPTDFELHCS